MGKALATRPACREILSGSDLLRKILESHKVLSHQARFGLLLSMVLGIRLNWPNSFADAAAETVKVAMRNRLLLLLAIFAIGMVSATASFATERALTRALSGQAVDERRVALVVGNNSYAFQPLRNPVNDARGMTRALKNLGFTVIHVENAKRIDMQKAILKFAEQLREGGTGLFYYAGHGLQVRGTNYLVPVDENITSEASIRFEAISLDAVLEQMGEPRPRRTNIVILDACRNNPYASRYGGSGGGLALVNAPTDFLVAYAAAPGGVAIDGDTDNGLYTGELLNAISEPGLRIEDVFKRTRAAVSEKTRFAQIPWEASSLVRDFSFNTGKPEKEPEETEQLAENQSQEERGVKASRANQALELEFWDSIKGSNNAADYEAYMEAFPNGIFVPLAKTRAERFRKSSQQAALPKVPGIEEIESLYESLTASNLREKPTAKSKRVGRVKAGTRLLATGKVENMNWYRVETPDGGVGYIYGDLIKKVMPGQATAAALAQAQQTAEAEQAAQRRADAEKAAEEAQRRADAEKAAKDAQRRADAEKAAKDAQRRAETEKAAKDAQRRAEAEKAAKDAQRRAEAEKAAKDAQRRADAEKAAEEAQRRAEEAKAAQLAAATIAQPKPSPPDSSGESFKDCATCPEMVQLPGGKFRMGSNFDASERPVHSVEIKSGFAIAKHEVTYGSWKACVTDGGCSHLPELKNATDRMPVRNVSWDDVQEYLRWLQKKTSKPYRLPSESEWEFAARASTTTSFWWGEEPSANRANCKDCGGVYDRKNPAEIGLYPPNGFGLHDMNGGVWEWVSDCWQGSYNGHPTDGSSWEKNDCRQRVLRGGSWRNDVSYLRSSSRFFYDSNVRYSVNGFRVALSLD